MLERSRQAELPFDGRAEPQVQVLRPPIEQVAIHLPGEAHPAVDLDGVGGGVEVGLRAVRLRQRRVLEEVFRVLRSSPCVKLACVRAPRYFAQPVEDKQSTLGTDTHHEVGAL